MPFQRAWLVGLGLLLATPAVSADILVYRADARFSSNNITTGILAGLTGPITVEIFVDTDAVPLGSDIDDINYPSTSGRVIGAAASVGDARIAFSIESGTEVAQDDFFLGPDVWIDSWSLTARDFRSSYSTGCNLRLFGALDIGRMFTASDWQLPTMGPQVIDISGYNVTQEVVIYGPTTATRITGLMESLQVYRLEECIADVTTTSTNPGDVGYGVPDGEVDGADLAYFVEAWLNDCE